MRNSKQTQQNPPIQDNLKTPLNKGASITKGNRGILAFTLVELIVVVTILAILATIGFVSYSSYLTGVRDTNRLAQLVSISDGLELYKTKKDLPLPDDNVEITLDNPTTTTIAYQGYAGANTLETIDFTKGGQDPRDGSYFTYYLTKDRKYFQLMGFLEEEASITSYSPITPSPLGRGLGGGVAHAADYTNRIPTVYGKKLGIITNTSNTPLQELISTSLNITTADTTNYVAHLSDTSKMTGSTAGSSDLEFLEIIATIGGNSKNTKGYYISCQQILDSGDSSGDGIYKIKPDGKTNIDVYCDMTTDGGGWTLITNRKEGTDSSEDCGTNVNEFFQVTSCGDVNTITKSVSYSIGVENRNNLEDIKNKLGGGSEIMFMQFINDVHDSDDTFIISTDTTLFPDTTASTQNILVQKICSLNGLCDSTNTYWKYTGNLNYAGANCQYGSSGTIYKGMYGYCLNGLDSSLSDIGLGGSRSGYDQVKLWNYNGGLSYTYQEKIFIR